MNMKYLYITILLAFITGLQNTNGQSLEDLSWLSGYWTSSHNGVSMEELWLSPSGNMMLGLHRDVFGNNRSSFEYLRIVQTENQITYLASPGGTSPTSFPLKEVSDQKAVFENLDHDFPQRIIYSLDDTDLTVRIEDQSGEKAMQWIWKKTTLTQKNE